MEMDQCLTQAGGKLLTGESCKDFAKLLASKASVPGGGGAAALVGALGVALCSMVGNFTVGKKKYAAVEEKVKSILERAESLRAQLLDLVDADARAFAPLAEAYGIPRDDPSRAEVLESATLNACKAPAEMVECCARALDLLDEMLEKGSAMLISDVGCGALLCRAAMESAAMNVFINTHTLNDRERAQTLESKIDSTLAEYGPKALKIVNRVNQAVRG